MGWPVLPPLLLGNTSIGIQMGILVSGQLCDCSLRVVAVGCKQKMDEILKRQLQWGGSGVLPTLTLVHYTEFRAHFTRKVVYIKCASNNK